MGKKVDKRTEKLDVFNREKNIELEKYKENQNRDEEYNN